MELLCKSSFTKTESLPFSYEYVLEPEKVHSFKDKYSIDLRKNILVLNNKRFSSIQWAFSAPDPET